MFINKKYMTINKAIDCMIKSYISVLNSGNFNKLKLPIFDFNKINFEEASELDE